MFSLKTRKAYLSPRTKVAEVDLEGLVCTSEPMSRVFVDELENVNLRKGSETGGTAEPLYFEF